MAPMILSPVKAGDVEFRTTAAVEEILLAGDGMFELARTLNPRLARSRPQVAERTDGPLSRPVRRANGLNQLIVGIGLALMGAGRSAQEHKPLQVTDSRVNKIGICNFFRHY